MLIFAEAPESLHAVELDSYLAQGWFRMGQTVFTTQFLCFQNQLYNAIWLRVDLKQMNNDVQPRKLAKNARSFRTEIQKATYSDAHTKLFQEYKKGVSFEGSSSLHQLLFDQHINNIYNTYEVNVYDEGKLIAAGIFDLGAESAAGISCFYDHEIQKIQPWQMADLSEDAVLPSVRNELFLSRILCSRI